MPPYLTIRSLLLEGGPLSPAEVVAGEEGLDNAVSWVVSLRPYTPAFPRLRGGELALVAAENLMRLDLPPSLSEVMRQLYKLKASGVAVKGEVDEEAAQTARELALPLIVLAPDAPMNDIEQAVMRECAMRHALAEVQPRTGAEWLAELLKGEDVTGDAPKEAVRYADKGALYAVGYVADAGSYRLLPSVRANRVEPPVARSIGELNLLYTSYEGGVVVLLPDGEQETLTDRLRGIGGTACGVGTAQPLKRIRRSLEEAQLAAAGSALLRECEPTFYKTLGADRLLLMLYRDAPEQLQSFVDETLGALLAHDAQSSAPLLSTLRASIEHGGRLRETAAALYVHRNTLAYRLERAAQIAGLDPRDSHDRLALELALRALSLIR